MLPDTPVPSLSHRDEPSLRSDGGSHLSDSGQFAFLQTQLSDQQRIIAQLAQTVGRIDQNLTDSSRRDRRHVASRDQESSEQEPSTNMELMPYGRVPALEIPANISPDIAAYIQGLVARSTEGARKPSRAFPYPDHIESIRLPKGFPPTFTLYRGTGSPLEHLG